MVIGLDFAYRAGDHAEKSPTQPRPANTQNIYRTKELSQGWTSDLTTHHVYAIVLDGDP